MSEGVIELRGLRVLARAGVPLAERAVAQPLEVDVDVHLDISAAIASDHMADSADYGMLVDAVVGAFATPAALLEVLVGRVVEAVLDADERVTAVTAWVRKVRPPVPHDLATAAVRLHRTR